VSGKYLCVNDSSTPDWSRAHRVQERQQVPVLYWISPYMSMATLSRYRLCSASSSYVLFSLVCLYIHREQSHSLLCSYPAALLFIFRLFLRSVDQ